MDNLSLRLTLKMDSHYHGHHRGLQDQDRFKITDIMEITMTDIIAASGGWKGLGYCPKHAGEAGPPWEIGLPQGLKAPACPF